MQPNCKSDKVSLPAFPDGMENNRHGCNWFLLLQETLAAHQAWQDQGNKSVIALLNKWLKYTAEHVKTYAFKWK